MNKPYSSESNIEDIILSICLLNEQDKVWMLSRLSDKEQQQLRIKLSDVETNLTQGSSLRTKDLAPSINKQVEEIRVLLIAGLQTNRDALLAFMNDEPSWVHAYLLGRYSQLLNAAIKDSGMKNRWNNVAGMDAINKGLLTGEAIQAINEAILTKLKSLDNHEKKFVDYMDAKS